MIQDIDPNFIQVIVDQSLAAYREELAPEIA